MTAQQALQSLLIERPGEVVTRRDVEARLGHPVSRQAVSNAAGRLTRRYCVGVLGRGGGYRFRDPEMMEVAE